MSSTNDFPKMRNDAAKKVTKIESEAKSAFPEINDIKDDLTSLKTDIAKLYRHVYKDGGKQVKEFANNKIGEVQDASRESLKKLEKRVTDKPTQSIAIAFAAGIVASILLGRK